MLPSLLAPDAFACAAMLVTSTSTGTLASSDAQQAILSRGDGTVTAEYRVRYAGDASDFGWVIPVPGTAIVVEEGSEARFTAIETATAPTVSTYTVDTSGGGGGGGCLGCAEYSVDAKGGSDNARGDLGGDDAGIAVIGTGYAGAFAYTILEAEDADGFLEWLELEGYDTSVSAAVIQEYIDEDASWVVARIRPDTPETADGGVVLNPLRVTWSGTELRYPARMAKASMLSEVRTELYVHTDSFAEPQDGWTYETADTEFYSIEGVEGEDPAALYTEHLRAIGGATAHLYGVWAGEYVDAVSGAGFLVRFDTLVHPEANAADVVFVENGETYTCSTSIGLYAGETPEADAAFLLPVGFLGLAWSRRRRR